MFFLKFNRCNLIHKTSNYLKIRSFNLYLTSKARYQKMNLLNTA